MNKTVLLLVAFILHSLNGQAKITTLSEIVKIKVKDAQTYKQVSLWRFKALIGPQVSKIELDPNIKSEYEFCNRSSCEDMKLSGEALMNAQFTQQIELFKNASKINPNFILQVEPEKFELKNDKKVRLYIIGTSWCGYCKPTAGFFINFFKNKADFEIIYMDVTKAEAAYKKKEDSSKFVMIQAMQAGAINSDFSYPTVVVEKDGNLLPLEAKEDFLSKIISER